MDGERRRTGQGRAAEQPQPVRLKLFAVLGFGEVAMLTAAALITITLLVYLNHALESQPAVLTPTPTIVGAAPAGRR